MADSPPPQIPLRVPRALKFQVDETSGLVRIFYRCGLEVADTHVDFGTIVIKQMAAEVLRREVAAAQRASAQLSS